MTTAVVYSKTLNFYTIDTLVCTAQDTTIEATSSLDVYIIRGTVLRTVQGTKTITCTYNVKCGTTLKTTGKATITVNLNCVLSLGTSGT